MTRTTLAGIDDYLARLRAALVAGGAEDADDVVAEMRSVLVDASGDNPADAERAIAELGDPGELARSILAERGADAAEMSSGVWWRLGVAAPIDIVVGVSLPLAAALPLYVLAAAGEPRSASILIAIVLGVAVLAWPLYVWRPWQRGGSRRSPGMILAGIAVIRTRDSWRVTRVSRASAGGSSGGRGLAVAVALVVLALVLLAGVALVAANIGGEWLSSATG